MDKPQTEFSSLDKRVGILDIPWINNFGACLISYALQEAVKDLGYHPEIINYRPQNFSGKRADLQRALKKQKQKIKRLIRRKKKESRSVGEGSLYAKKFESFRAKHLIYSKPCDAELSVNTPLYPRYIVGSDVVWKPARIASHEKNAYFLTFAPENSVKIAYAASIGTDDPELLAGVENIFREHLDSFDSISVREKTSCEYLRQFTEKPIERCIDPTILLEKSAYSGLADAAEDPLEGNYLFLYVLGSMPEDAVAYVNTLARKLELPIVYYGTKDYPCDKALLRKDCIADGPAEFLSRIKNAKYVITDSFHGTVFSVLFHKNFYTFGRGKISIRMTDLLALLGTQECFVRDFSTLPYEFPEIDFAGIDRLLEKERNCGLQYLSQALSQKKATVNRIAVPNENVCCGCGACAAVCPNNCIELKARPDGSVCAAFTAADACIQCGACAKACPVLNLQQKTPDEFFALRNLDENVTRKSTSGGAFTAIAEAVLSAGGLVYGAAFDEQMNLAHRSADSLEAIAGMRGSKYIFCADPPGLFQEIREQLRSGKTVLYVGAPCQCAALYRQTLRYKERLLLVDFVCHGCPGNGLWKKYLRENHKKKVTDAKFRGKEAGWKRGPCNFHLEYEDGTCYNRKSTEDSFYYSFLSGVALRDYCFTCAFKKYSSHSDLTLGDFWGVEKYRPDLYSASGVSLCIVHSEQGEKLLNSLENISLSPIREEDATRDNPRIFCPLPYNERRKKFAAYIEKHSYDTACRKTFGWKYSLVRLKKSIVRNLAKR
ncbi:MAG: polysaccharide pyruvyl transferase family protein [Lachnospiraceae bacterium]|nr:polysaccharide pyruvyl transferase family protein [Lachnospiraceae bacterium]